MNRDEKPEDPLSKVEPVDSEVKETPQDQSSLPFKELNCDGNIENFAAWLEMELEKLESRYQGFSTSSSRRTFFGR